MSWSSDDILKPLFVVVVIDENDIYLAASLKKSDTFQLSGERYFPLCIFNLF